MLFKFQTFITCKTVFILSLSQLWAPHRSSVGLCLKNPKKRSQWQVCDLRELQTWSACGKTIYVLSKQFALLVWMLAIGKLKEMGKEFIPLLFRRIFDFTGGFHRAEFGVREVCYLKPLCCHSRKPLWTQLFPPHTFLYVSSKTGMIHSCNICSAGKMSGINFGWQSSTKMEQVSLKQLWTECCLCNSGLYLYFLSPATIRIS